MMGLKVVAAVLITFLTFAAIGCVVNDIVVYPVEGLWGGQLTTSRGGLYNVTMLFEHDGNVTITQSSTGAYDVRAETAHTSWRPEGDHYVILFPDGKMYVSIDGDTLSFPNTGQADYFYGYGGGLTKNYNYQTGG